MITPDQFLAAQKSYAQAAFTFGATAFSGAEKLAELNLQVAKTSLTEAAETTAALLSVKDAQELIALQTGLLQPTGEKLAAYGRHVADIGLSTSAELGKLAESQFGDVKSKFDGLVENLAKNAPAGTENAVALVKSAVAAANNTFESVQKAAKQAGEIAEANFQAATSTAVKASQTASRSSKRAAA